MTSPDYLIRPIDAARAVRARYFHDFDDSRYRFSNFLSQILIDEGIKCEELPSNEDEFGGFYRIFPFGPVIVVNSNMSKSRQLFTVAHELGHHFLHRNRRNEFTDIKKNLFENGKKPFVEVEANRFAAEVLVPRASLIVMMRKRLKFVRIADNFGASLAVVKWRIVSFLRDEFYTSESEAINLVEEYILASRNGQRDDVRLFRYTDDFQVISSATKPVTKPAKLHLGMDQSNSVTICAKGSEQIRRDGILTHGRVAYMELKHPVKVDQSMRFEQCPRCRNMEFSTDAKYCKMCGLELLNRCMNERTHEHHNDCGRLNVPEARYCEYCGTETYLVHLGVFKPWENHVQQETPAQSAGQYEDDPFADSALPDISDEDLPF